MSYRISYSILVLSTIIFLSGSIYGINYKLPLSLLVFLLLITLIIKNGYKLNKINLMLIVSFSSLICIGAYFGIVNGYPIDYVKEEVIGFLSPLIIISLFNNRFYNISLMKRITLFGIIMYSLLKVIFCILIMLDVVYYIDFHDMLVKLFDYEIMSFLISPNLNIVRIYSINDLLVCLSPLFILGEYSIVKRKYLKLILIILMCLCIFLAFSRFLFFLFFFMIILSLYRNSKISTKSLLLNILLIGSVYILILVYGLPSFITDRFDSSNIQNISSDYKRNLQADAIKSMISSHWFIPAGLGSYTTELVRSKYVYELQWYSFIFKFGIILFVILLLIIFSYYCNNFYFSLTSITIFFLLLGTGLFNPYLQSTVIGLAILIVYTFFPKNLIDYSRNNEKYKQKRLE